VEMERRRQEEWQVIEEQIQQEREEFRRQD
jgi:hypothetical protein